MYFIPESIQYEADIFHEEIADIRLYLFIFDLLKQQGHSVIFTLNVWAIVQATVHLHFLTFTINVPTDA